MTANQERTKEGLIQSGRGTAHFRLPFALSFRPGSSPPLLVILTGQILDGYGRRWIASGTSLPELHARFVAISELDAGAFESALYGGAVGLSDRGVTVRSFSAPDCSDTEL